MYITGIYYYIITYTTKCDTPFQIKRYREIKKKKNIDYKIGKKNYRFKIDNNILCKKDRK